MRNTVVSIIALLFLTTTFAMSPAYANDFAKGDRFSLAMEGFQTSVFPGDSITGTVTIVTEPSIRRSEVKWEVLVTTPIGDATVQSGEFVMRGGRSRTIPLEFPIEPDAEPGLYRVKLVVTYDNEQLSVGHEFRVEKGA